MRKKGFWPSYLLVKFFLLAMVGTPLAVAASPAEFYKDKSLTVIQGRKPGGTGDLRVRLLVPYIKNHLAGRPDIIFQYMPGGGGRIAANHIARAARPNGLTVANVGSGLVANAVVNAPGVRYELSDFIFLGSPNSIVPYVLLSRKELGLDTLQELKSHTGLRIGAQSVGHTIYNAARTIAFVLGLKDVRMITGYSGTELDLALERGEIDSRVQVASTIPIRSPQFLETMNFHVFLGPAKGKLYPKELPRGIPNISDYADSEAKRSMLNIFLAVRGTGSPWIFPKGVPKEAVQSFRQAMNKALNDPEFVKRWKSVRGVSPTPVTGEEQERLIQAISSDPSTLSLWKKLTGAGPLPNP